MKSRIVLLTLCIFSCKVFAAPPSKTVQKQHIKESKENRCPYTPWFAGTLLEPSSTNQDPGHANIQPFVFYIYNYGEYQNNWSVENIKGFSQTIENVISQVGITKHFQVLLTLQGQSTFFNGKTSSHFSDLSFGAAFQLLWEKKNQSTPNIRLIFQETFPTGTYEFLDPHFLSNDATGKGAYTSTATVVASKLVYPSLCHPIYFNSSINISYSTPTKVRGYNVYGGGEGTNGKVGPRWSFSGDLSLEYSITQNFVFALDIIGQHLLPMSFSGQKGIDVHGIENELTTSSTTLLTLTPAIEYNFSNKLGLVIGGTFSIAGRNINATAQGIASLTYAF